jgi:hypothetical protein
MAKIQLTYNVPDGDYCSHVFEERHMVPECRFLLRGSWCTLMGAQPVSEVNGHTIIRQKLYACKRAHVTPQSPVQNPDPQPAPRPTDE